MFTEEYDVIIIPREICPIVISRLVVLKASPDVVVSLSVISSVIWLKKAMHLNIDTFKINTRTFEAKLTKSGFGEIEDFLNVFTSISIPLNNVDSFRDLKCELNFMQDLISC